MWIMEQVNGMSRINVCAACGASESWADEDLMWRVTGEEGADPEEITVVTCKCGNKQKKEE